MQWLILTWKSVTIGLLQTRPLEYGLPVTMRYRKQQEAHISRDTLTQMVSSETTGLLSGFYVSMETHWEVQGLTLSFWSQWPGGPVDLGSYWPDWPIKS